MRLTQAALSRRRTEFFQNVWDHTADPFQVQFDARRELTGPELVSLKRLVDAFACGKSDSEIAKLIRKEVRGSSDDLLATLLQLVGSTRNKIITDLKAQVAREGSSIPSAYDGLVHNDAAWALAGDYLAKRMRTVLGPLAANTIDAALEALNQATYPGYIRQQRAKLQGHEAEARLAGLLKACEIPFEPREKAENPLCRDAQIEGVSFDLVVPSVSSPKVCVKATVHTANIGQYGESKDALEVEEAQSKLAARYGQSRPIVLVLADGIGFRSNSAGLDGVLSQADEFCQFRTLWKGAVVGAWATGRVLPLYLPEKSHEDHKPFLANYSDSIKLLERSDDAKAHHISAGEGVILRR